MPGDASELDPLRAAVRAVRERPAEPAAPGPSLPRARWSIAKLLSFAMVLALGGTLAYLAVRVERSARCIEVRVGPAFSAEVVALDPALATGPTIGPEELWRDAIAREFPEWRLVADDPARVRMGGRNLGDRIDVLRLQTLVIERTPGSPEIALGVSVTHHPKGRVPPRMPMTVLWPEVPATHEIEVSFLEFGFRERSLREIVTGAPRTRLEIEARSGKRGIAELIRWADGPPWGREIWERALEEDR